MNITNINLKYCLNDNEKIFIENILKSSNFIGSVFLKKILDTTPVFVLNINDFDKKLRKLEISFDEENNKKNDRYPAIELLGFYTRKKIEFSEKTPIIVICLEKIVKITSTQQEFLFLTTIVLIHELAHAFMDIEEENTIYGKKDEFFDWMEESIANLMPLEVIYYTSDLLQFYEKTTTSICPWHKAF